MGEQSPLKISDMTVRYHKSNQDALSDLSFEIEPQTITGLFGPNGAGKSTVIKAALGLISYKGDVKFYGRNFDKVRKKIAYIPQRKDIDWTFPVNVLDVCLMGLHPHIGLFRRINKKHKEKAMHYLEQVGMQDSAKSPIGMLSGGQQQRVFMARALAQDPDLFLLDEPMAGVDQKSQSILFAMLNTLKQDGKTSVIVHHNMHGASDIFDRAILLNKKTIAYGSPDEALSKENITKAYGADS